MNIPSQEAMIVLNNVSKWYGDFNVLRNCTTSIHKGDSVRAFRFGQIHTDQNCQRP